VAVTVITVELPRLAPLGIAMLRVAVLDVPGKTFVNIIGEIEQDQLELAVKV
jgi:hypothetical protein